MDIWKLLRKFETDDDLDTWLKQQGLTNSQAIINRVTLEAPVTFAQGLKRIRYDASKYYIEELELKKVSNWGTGAELKVDLIQAALQKAAGRTKVIVKLYNNQSTAVHILTTDKFSKGQAVEFFVGLNPGRLQNSRSVNEAVDWLLGEMKH